MQSIGKKYRTRRDNVIDIFEHYKDKRGDLNDGVDIEYLDRRIDSLKKNKFMLAVAGEVKAGKSTFINALLGAEILPVDVLQASSTIVEVCKAPAPFLRVKYLDGTEENFPQQSPPPTHTSDTREAIEKKIKQRLRQICAIREEYRQISTTQIDDDIINNALPAQVDDAYVNKLQGASNEKLAGKHGLIKKYIEQRGRKVPVEIELGYPLEWNFDELRLVDSPGVNATGGVQDRTYQFIAQADAILFVHPIKPVESESFRKFVDNVIPNRSQGMLFLVLTHAGPPNTDDEVEKLCAEAKRLYGDKISEDRILAVDSLLGLIYKDLARGVPLEEIEKCQKKEDAISIHQNRATKKGKKLIDVVRESSGFVELSAAIDEFSMRAPLENLREIVEKIKAGYEAQENRYDEDRKMLEDKRKDPQEFAVNIDHITNDLDQLKLFFNETGDALKKEWTGTQAPWKDPVEELETKYQQLIRESQGIDSLRKNFFDASNSTKDIQKEYSQKLSARITEALEEQGRAFKAKYQISIPQVDLDALEKHAKEAAWSEEAVYETHEVDRKWDFGDWVSLGLARWFRDNKEEVTVQTGTKEVFDEDKFLEGFKTKCESKFCDIIVPALKAGFPKYLEECLNSFKDEMDSLINARQKDLEEVKHKQQSNQEIIAEIEDLGKKKASIQSEKLRCIELLEDLEKLI